MHKTKYQVFGFRFLHIWVHLLRYFYYIIGKKSRSETIKSTTINPFQQAALGVSSPPQLSHICIDRFVSQGVSLHLHVGHPWTVKKPWRGNWNDRKTQLHLILGLMSGKVYNWLHQATTQWSSVVCPGFIVLSPVPFVPIFPPSVFSQNIFDPTPKTRNMIPELLCLDQQMHVLWLQIWECILWTHVCVCVCVCIWNTKLYNTNCISFWGLTCKVWSGFPGSCWLVKAPGGSFNSFPRKERWQVDLGWRCVAILWA